MAQFGRRTTVLTLDRFEVVDEPGRVVWRNLLPSIERQLVLADRWPGMLADDLSDYLFARSTGHFASLMTLIRRRRPHPDRTPGHLRRPRRQAAALVHVSTTERWLRDHLGDSDERS